MLDKEGKPAKDTLELFEDITDLKATSLEEKLQDRANSLDPADTCIDDIYQSRKKIWKKMGLAPLEVLTGGLIGAGAGAAGATAFATSGRLAEFLLKLGYTRGSVAATGALWGGAVGAVGMAAIVIGKEIYYRVKLVKTAKMIDLVTQSRLKDKYGQGEDFNNFTRKILGKKRKTFLEQKDMDLVSGMITQLDREGRLCGKGDVTSYGKMKKLLKKRGELHEKYSGKTYEATCQTSSSQGEETLNCKVKEKANKSNCKSNNLRLMGEGQSLYFAVDKTGECLFQETALEGVPSVKLTMKGDVLVPESVDLPKGSTEIRFKSEGRDAKEAYAIESTIQINEDGKTSTQSCMANKMVALDSGAKHRKTRVAQIVDEKADKISTSCGFSEDDNGTLEVLAKAKEKGNKTKCSNDVSYGGSSGGGGVAIASGAVSGLAAVLCERSALVVDTGNGSDPVITEVSQRVESTPLNGGEQIKVITTLIDRKRPGGTLKHRNSCETYSGSNGTTTHTCEASGDGYSSSCTIRKGGKPSKIKNEIKVEKEV